MQQIISVLSLLAQKLHPNRLALQRSLGNFPQMAYRRYRQLGRSLSGRSKAREKSMCAFVRSLFSLQLNSLASIVKNKLDRTDFDDQAHQLSANRLD